MHKWQIQNQTSCELDQRLWANESNILRVIFRMKRQHNKNKGNIISNQQNKRIDAKPVTFCYDFLKKTTTRKQESLDVFLHPISLWFWTPDLPRFLRHLQTWLQHLVLKGQNLTRKKKGLFLKFQCDTSICHCEPIIICISFLKTNSTEFMEPFKWTWNFGGVSFL